MKKLFVSVLAMAMFFGMTTLAFADYAVQVTWTPSPNAASEVLLLDGTEQTCPERATCSFVVAELTNQAVVIRSSNSQGGYVDYAAGTLSEDPLPTPASNANIIIINIQQ